MRKIFYGLAINDVNAKHLCDLLRQQYPELCHHIKWVKANNFHVTLRYLGYVKPEKITDFSQVLHEKLNGIAKFSININKILRFPNDHSRIIAGRCDLSAALTELFARLNSQVLQLGISPDAREFKPHITLGRTKSTSLATFEPMKIADYLIEVTEVLLYESRPGQFGNDYHILERYTLL
ncbi:MAG: RNA 2',3'-cyclic phosphodiesterase [Gammaproteobacteria bacterium]|nr:RNA 2',3'-cyclic phosphodiesterase [Gammaproteobacteria bacterium]MCH9743452.1 RNA 2',3'-cyclic phosphodiesterase [Gammaproteobacteria bacterium]